MKIYVEKTDFQVGCEQERGGNYFPQIIVGPLLISSPWVFWCMLAENVSIEWQLMVGKQTFIPSFSVATAEESKLEIKRLLMQREFDLCRKVFSGVNYNSLLPVQTV